MNIAILTPQFIVGGAETYVIRKSMWLKEQGHNVFIISAGGCMVDLIPPEVTHIEFKSFKISPYAISPGKLKESLILLSSILSSKQIDVIEAHNTLPITYAVLSYKFHKIPYVFNDLLELDFNNSFQLRCLARWLSKKNLFYVLTESMKTYVEDVCDNKMNIKVIPIPISSPVDNATLSVGKYFLAVARFSSDKMYLKELISSFDKYLKLMKGGACINYLYVVGDGDTRLKDEIYNAAITINEKYGYEAVVLLGSIVGKQLDELYAQCAAFVGMGTSLLIAASYNKPCILSSGELDLYRFAYGFWGMNVELDKDAIAGNINYIPYKMTFTDALLKVTDVDFFKLAGLRAKSLFQQVYDMDIVMKKWENEFFKVACLIEDRNLLFLSYKLLIYNFVMYILFYIKQFAKKIF